ncbi:Methyltransferase domain-containing protein [Allopseudospirillum japonicum]|uniref:Methyltransferase domain-containing protein n=1 Tax=Allopseudospirillum japonicum TaxID=64971 RepID=A0A1H6TLF5_9GAMM|nr:class I SAM-dependent methyltransferase [Allopseudospirillum japonicum]SEI76602.1 Methyltransferase domain-containing protein [Allopseudospirillum japonicum]
MSTTSDYAQQLNQHYADTHIIQRLREALIAEDLDPDHLTYEDIATLDQLHVGGRRASLQLADRLLWPAGLKVLDLGCGTGGSSRLLHQSYGAQVIGVDITSAFIEIARWFNRATGCASIDMRCEDACALSLESASVQRVWSQHTLMNIPQITQALSEIKRVLFPQGALILHEIVRGENLEPLTYPVPWARSPHTSHLLSLTELDQHLQQAGFTPYHQADISAQALAWRQKHSDREARGQTGLLTPELIFGADFLSMGANLMKNLAQDKVRIMELIYHAP